ncbi:hypothetical protein M2138_000187 [Dysgonomonadaceae bacterium PH5-43]|nr:hypothetical protein [Dysgonomonadaceae bacterium PH5-43]
MKLENEKKEIASTIQKRLTLLNESIVKAREIGLTVNVESLSPSLGYIGSPIKIDVYEKVKYCTSI